MSITINEKQPPCRFNMFTRRKRESVGPVRNSKELFTYRGDKYNEEPEKMMRYLLGIVVNYRKQFAVMMLEDNAKPKHDPERVILKILNGEPKINRLPAYSYLLSNYALPEYLSYEITNELN